jgi:hypothetical protein
MRIEQLTVEEIKQILNDHFQKEGLLAENIKFHVDIVYSDFDGSYSYPEFRGCEIKFLNR